MHVLIVLYIGLMCCGDLSNFPFKKNQMCGIYLMICNASTITCKCLEALSVQYLQPSRVSATKPGVLP